MPVRALPCIAKFTVLALLSLACAKSPPSGGPGTYQGVVANVANEIGLLDVEVTESDKGSLHAEGTLKFPNRTLSLTGTLDRSKTLLSLSTSDGYKIDGLSRPSYSYGSYTDSTGNDTGSFALLFQTSGSTIERYCGSGSFTIPVDASTQDITLPIAITAISGGEAFCVGPNFMLMGGLGTDKAISCAAPSGGLIEGNINNKDNPWDTGGPAGKWTVIPCASNGAVGDAGIPDDAGGSADTGT
jgi:hypothetical protein